MNIVCEKTLLSNAIDGVSRAVTLRSSISALEGIHMVADGFSLTSWEGGGGYVRVDEVPPAEEASPTEPNG